MDAFLTTRMWKAKEGVINFFKEESGETNIIAIILVIVVVIALVGLLKDELADLVTGIFDKVFDGLGIENTNNPLPDTDVNFD